MSEQTRQELERAIISHYFDEYGTDLAPHWTVVANTLEADNGDGCVEIESSHNQPTFVTLGLLSGAVMMLNGKITAAVIRGEEQ